MQTIEEVADVTSLCTQPRAGRLDDLRIQSEALRDVYPRRRARNTKPEFVGWLERGFVEADRSIHNPGRIRPEDFQRRVVRGDDRETLRTQEVLSNSDRQRCAFFRISGRAEFIEQDERVRGCRSRNEINVGDMRRKR